MNVIQGKEESSIKDCSRALELHPHYMKALLRRAELYERTEKLDEALADYQKALEMDPMLPVARAACMVRIWMWNYVFRPIYAILWLIRD